MAITIQTNHKFERHNVATMEYENLDEKFKKLETS
ncbi:hypothetical protein AN944_01639 [Shewanella sp. P1-14-1]|nr:hypothetical protein AN944_01639 [Shewanella sp. P1-14-1]